MKTTVWEFTIEGIVHSEYEKNMETTIQVC